MSVDVVLSDLDTEYEALLAFMYMCPVGALQITGDGTITLVNPHAMSLLMPVSSNAGVTNLYTLLAPHDPELPDIVRTFAGANGAVFRGRRITIPQSDPRQPGCVMSCDVLMINRDCMMVLLQDISQVVALELEVEATRRQAQSNDRLVALGAMAGGIAHEINNPLAVIHALAEDLGEIAERGEVHSANIAGAASDLIKLSGRIERIIRSVLSLARDGAQDLFTHARLVDIVDNAESLCRALFRTSNVTLEIAPIDAGIGLYCREVQIIQVLVNLLQNACYAAKSGTAPKVTLQATQLGAQIEIRVNDNGPGVPPAIRERILDPFFTTKPVGEGTGLGLSIAAEIARAHNGSISLDAAGAETCFVLTLGARADRSNG